jgi:hypothetical protein
MKFHTISRTPMQLLNHICATIMLCVLCNNTEAQTLWRNSIFGMTKEQVITVVPEAAPVAGKHGTLKTGAEELLRILGVEIVNEKFTASFFFKDQKLVQVMLSLENPKSFVTTMIVFNALTDSLRAKYGQEISLRQAQTPYPNAEAIWLSGRTNISVNADAVAETSVYLKVNYQVRITREADKL